MKYLRRTIEAHLPRLRSQYPVLTITGLRQSGKTNLGKRLIKSPKLYFYDVGLAVRLLEIEHATHLRHHPLRGNLFENLVVAEVLKHRYHRGRPDNLSFYRDSKETRSTCCCAPVTSRIPSKSSPDRR